MILAVLGSAIIGGALGLRFRVMIIVPTGVLVVFLVGMLGITQSEPLMRIMLATGASLAALEMGYLAVCFGRYLVLSGENQQRDASLAEEIGGLDTGIYNVVHFPRAQAADTVAGSPKEMESFANVEITSRRAKLI
jgi:hypothetical protein